MNWISNVRSNDGGMNGLEFARCLTAGDLRRVLVHAAPGQAAVEDGRLRRAGSPAGLVAPAVSA